MKNIQEPSKHEHLETTSDYTQTK